MTSILGISAFYHDSAAALVIDGRIVAAAQEERFTRIKHDHEFPENAIQYCLDEAGLTPEQLDYVGFYDKPLLKFERILETYLAFAPGGFGSFLQAMPLWLRQKLHLPREMNKGLLRDYKRRYVFPEHHESQGVAGVEIDPEREEGWQKPEPVHPSPLEEIKDIGDYSGQQKREQLWAGNPDHRRGSCRQDKDKGPCEGISLHLQVHEDEGSSHHRADPQTEPSIGGMVEQPV